MTPTPSKITLHINNTPQGRLLARAITIMDHSDLPMGDAMDQARAEAETPTLPAGSHVYVLFDEPGGDGIGAIEGFVLSTGLYSSDVVIVPSRNNLTTAFAILADADIILSELPAGPVHIMRDVKNETLKLVSEMER